MSWVTRAGNSLSGVWNGLLDWAANKMFRDLRVNSPSFNEACDRVESPVSLTPELEREALLLDFCLDWMGRDVVDVISVYQWLSTRPILNTELRERDLYDGDTLAELKVRLAYLNEEDLRSLVISLLIQKRILEKYTPPKELWLDLSMPELATSSVEFQRGALWAQAKLKMEKS